MSDEDSEIPNLVSDSSESSSSESDGHPAKRAAPKKSSKNSTHKHSASKKLGRRKAARKQKAEDEWSESSNDSDELPRMNKINPILETLWERHTAKAIVGILGLKLTGKHISLTSRVCSYTPTQG